MVNRAASWKGHMHLRATRVTFCVSLFECEEPVSELSIAPDMDDQMW